MTKWQEVQFVQAPGTLAPGLGEYLPKSPKKLNSGYASMKKIERGVQGVQVDEAVAPGVVE